MIEWGSFVSHSGLILPWKVNCDLFTDEDWAALAQIVRSKFAFSAVIGVPRGGLSFAAALKPYTSVAAGYRPTLLVDDVLTTGRSMEEWRKTIFGPTIGIVVIARGPVPDWVWPIFVVQEWARG